MFKLDLLLRPVYGFLELSYAFCGYGNVLGDSSKAHLNDSLQSVVNLNTYHRCKTNDLYLDLLTPEVTIPATLILSPSI